MSKLLDSRSVLEYDRNSTEKQTNNPDSLDWVVFSSPIDEEGAYISRQIIFRRDDWEDMGKPRQVTVTIEPGDKLNSDVCSLCHSNLAANGICATCLTDLHA